MSLVLNSSGGGSVTLQEPVTASNRTLTLPDATGSLITESMDLLGTLTTTSGTTAVLSGLDLTSYSAIFISINRCSHNSGSNQEFQLLDANGSTYLSINSATAASAFVSGICQISLINGAIASNIGTNATSTTPLVDSPSGTVAGITTFSTSATSFTFRFAAGNFDNGSISVYGVK